LKRRSGDSKISFFGYKNPLEKEKKRYENTKKHRFFTKIVFGKIKMVKKRYFLQSGNMKNGLGTIFFGLGAIFRSLGTIFFALERFF